MRTEEIPGQPIESTAGTHLANCGRFRPIKAKLYHPGHALRPITCKHFTEQRLGMFVAAF
jgi:hypothetical protein